MSGNVGGRSLDRRHFLGGGLAGAALLGAAACRGAPSGNGGGGNGGGGDGGGEVSLSAMWWGEASRSEMFAEAVELFAGQHEDVTINSEYSGFGGYFDKLATRVAGGNQPSIFQLHAVSMGDYVSRGVVRELDDLLADPLGLDTLPDYVKDSCTFDGSFMLVPLGLATAPAMVVNTAVLERLGVDLPPADWTFEDFGALVRAVNAADSEMFGSVDASAKFVAFEHFVRSREQGANLFTPDGEIAFTVDDATEWFATWEELRADGAVPPMETTSAAQGFEADPMVTGLAAMTMAASSKGIEGHQRLVEDQLALFQFPTRNVEASLLAPVEWFALSADLSDEEARVAAEMCHFILTDTEAMSTVELHHGVPLFEEGREFLRAEIDTPVVQQIFDNVDEVAATDPWARVSYPAGMGSQIADLMRRTGEQIGFGEVSVEDGSAQFVEDAEQLAAEA